MVYTGKLPVGKHNVSRIVAAADSLQMFDVAVGFKKVLTTLVKQQPPVQAGSGQTQAQTPTLNSEAQSPNPELSPPADAAHTSLDSMELKKEHSESENKDGEEPEPKRTRLEPSESTGENQQSSRLPVDVKNKEDMIELIFYNRDANFLNIRTFSRTNGIFCSAPSSDCSPKFLYVPVHVCPEPEAAASESEGNAATAELSDQHHTDLGERFPRLVKLLSDVPSVQQLLSQAAQRTLDGLDQEVEQVHLL